METFQELSEQECQMVVGGDKAIYAVVAAGLVSPGL